MSELDTEEWRAANDEYISATVAWVLSRLESLVAGADASSVEASEKEQKLREDRLTRLESESTLHQLADRFELSLFEIHLLSLCLAFELDSRVAHCCGELQPTRHQPFPTLGLALRLFPESADWAVASSSRPLRGYQLIQLHQPAGVPLVGAELRLEEPILHYLRGVPDLDEHVSDFVTIVESPAVGLFESQQAQLHQIHAILASSQPVQLVGTSSDDLLAVAIAASAGLNRYLYRISAESLPNRIEDLNQFCRRWNRDSQLYGLCLLIDATSAVAADKRSLAQSIGRVARLVETPVFVASRELLSSQDLAASSVAIEGASRAEQFLMWSQILPEGHQHREIAGRLSQQFSVNPSLAQRIITSVGSISDQDYEKHLWHACRHVSRPSLHGLAQRVDTKATWEQLVINEESKQLLAQVLEQVRMRWRVYEDWGLSQRLNRGMGISALFAGASGTGKTMAAEVLANALDLDLYRVDLASVVDKYIGETEKHLREVFDQFESCGAVLLFDECDALFGKRSEVKDSHDRFANIEVNYLLQRLEAYRGLVILATNKRGALDSAFMRRLRFVINFELPTTDEREKIWRGLLPGEKDAVPRIPLADLDFTELAKFNLSGGSIQNVVLNAAFRAASRPINTALTMDDLMSSVRDEYQKLQQPMNPYEFQNAPSQEVVV